MQFVENFLFLDLIIHTQLATLHEPYIMILVIASVMLCIASIQVGAQCPTGCTCTDRIATCVGIDYIPLSTHFPNDTQEFIFRNCDYSTKLPKMPYAHATKVLIIHSGVLEFDEKPFEGMPLLTQLDLHHNPIEDLPPNVFAGLSNLEHLVVIGTALQSIANEHFAGLPKLRTLDLSFNRYLRFDKTELVSLSLDRLDLVGCELPDAQLVAADAQFSVTQLVLRENKIRKLQNDAFAGVKNLQHLVLSNNSIDDVATGAFAGLTQLQSLDLDVNQVSELPDEVFDATVALTSVNLMHNNLELLDVSDRQNKTLWKVNHRIRNAIDCFSIQYSSRWSFWTRCK